MKIDLIQLQTKTSTFLFQSTSLEVEGMLKCLQESPHKLMRMKYPQSNMNVKTWRKKNAERHPDTISNKTGQPPRRAVEISVEGPGVLKKESKVDVPCYYFVLQYADDYSDYSGGCIVCQNGTSIELEDDKLKTSNDHSHILKGDYFFAFKNFD